MEMKVEKYFYMLEKKGKERTITLYDNMVEEEVKDRGCRFELLIETT